ncbi:MAG: hypothetical protein ABEJ81_05110 [Haloferacaceae archaeon]
MTDRGQLSLPLVEAVVGLVLILGVSVAFVVDVPGPGRETAQLERYADDAATTLADAPVRGDEEGPLVARALDSQRAFERRGDRLHRRAERLMPPSVRLRLLTPYGALGPPRPPGVTTGRARVTTASGTVTVVVWYG